MRGGSKHTTAHLVIYLKRVESNSARFGFVVSKAVGGAVQRNLVKRRLRAIAREWLAKANSTQVVVRALEGAAQLSFDQLNQEVEQGLTSAISKAAK